MKKILFSCILFIQNVTYAQTGIGTTTPDPTAALDISSTQKGVLLPRLNAAQLATLVSTLTPAQRGMMVTDATTGKPYYWNGSGWKDFSTLAITTSSPLSISSTNTISLNPGTAAGDLITWDGNNWVNMQPAHFTVSSVNNLQPYLTLNYCIALQGIFPSRNTPFLGEIDIYSFAYPPKGWAFCNGQLLPINQNQAIFALLGTTYGGNGQTTFALPNLQGRIPLHTGAAAGPGLSPYTLGQTGGIEQNTISH